MVIFYVYKEKHASEDHDLNDFSMDGCKINRTPLRLTRGVTRSILIKRETHDKFLSYATLLPQTASFQVADH